MRKKILTVAVLTMLAAFSGQALAFWGWGGEPGAKKPAGRERSIKRPDRKEIQKKLSEKLSLTAEQQKKFQEQNEKLSTLMKAQREAMAKNAEELKQEMAKDQPDRKKIRSLIEQINKSRLDNELKRTDLLLELRQILTPEQRKKFQQLLAEKPSGPAAAEKERGKRPAKKGGR